MQEQQKECWREPCELAAKEQNPERLMDLVTRINRILEQKEQRLAAAPKQEVVSAVVQLAAAEAEDEDPHR